jgi:hypothetical protein
MFVLNSCITIGSFKKVKPHEVKITKSVHEYVDRAFIHVPTTARLQRAGEVITESADTAKQFKEGDFVNINLGYNGKLVNEFKGFVTKINFKTPIEVECEGYSYQLRKNQYLKVFKNTKLIDILTFLIADTDITINKKHLSDVMITKLVLQKNNGVEALEMIKKMLNNLVKIYFQGSVLCAELFPVVPFAETAFYKLGWNVVKDDSLKLKEPKNEDITVVYKHTSVDGTRIKGTHKLKQIVTKGKATGNGETKEVKSSIKDEATLSKLAKADANKQSYKGYEGKIKTFLQPYCEPAWRASITDAKYPERSGIYLVESTEVTYGMGGARRTVGIGIKL